MKVSTIDGKKYVWKINGEEVVLDRRNRSSLHVEARAILREKFPTLQILEEVSIEVRRGKTLYLDFYIPVRRLAIEVHGEQHFAYSSFFHKSAQDFMQQKKNDGDKAEFCEINGIDLIILPFNQVKEWANLL